MAAEGFNIFQTMTVTPRSFPEMELFDIEGNRVNVKRLAAIERLILITIKSITCPVCPQLLKYLNVLGLDPEISVHIDPFTGQEIVVENSKKKLYRLLLKQDASFIVLCPGTNAEVRDIQVETHFARYPFISSEGGADQLVKALKVQLSEHEYMPAILEVSPDATSANPISIGRGPGNYFHEYLIKHLLLERCKEEVKGFATLSHAYGCVHQLKRRALKCQDGSIAPKLIRLNLTLKKESTASEKVASAGLTELPKKVKELERVEEGTENRGLSTRNSYSILERFPSELLEMILYHIGDVTSLVMISAVSRDFYIAVCSVLTKYIREQITLLRESLPDIEDAVAVSEMDLMDEKLDRWRGNEEQQDRWIGGAISCRQLELRITTAKELLSDIHHWIENWKPRNRGRRHLLL